jgi:DNA-binding XRE family transcriptional regulator
MPARAYCPNRPLNTVSRASVSAKGSENPLQEELPNGLRTSDDVQVGVVGLLATVSKEPHSLEMQAVRAPSGARRAVEGVALGAGSHATRCGGDARRAAGDVRPLGTRPKARPAIKFMPGVLMLLGPRSFETPKSLPGRLLSARELLGLTQAGLAEKIGVDRGTVGDWERGVRLPSEERLAAVEALLSPGGGKPA